MNVDKIDDHFIFIYELEPSELCTNFRFASPNLQRADLPETASFSVWKNMLVVFYAIHTGAYPFDVLRERAHYFATIVVSCYGWLTGKPLELVRKNWDLAKQSRHANILVAVLDPETVQRQLNFVGSLLSAFTEYISLSGHASKLDSPQNPAST
jgi:hypothetical protein